MNTASTFGLRPSDWWLQFRRHLDYHRVRKMNDRQWRYALRLAENRSIPPDRAAELVAGSR